MTSPTTFSPLQSNREKKYESRDCPACGAKRSHSFANKQEERITTDLKVPKFEIRVCAICGVLYNKVKVIGE